MEVVVIIKSKDGDVLPVTVKCRKFELDDRLVIVNSKDITEQVDCTLPKRKYQLIDIKSGLFLTAFDKYSDNEKVFNDIKYSYEAVLKTNRYQMLVEAKEKALNAIAKA